MHPGVDRAKHLKVLHDVIERWVDETHKDVVVPMAFALAQDPKYDAQDTVYVMTQVWVRTLARHMVGLREIDVVARPFPQMCTDVMKMFFDEVDLSVVITINEEQIPSKEEYDS